MHHAAMQEFLEYVLRLLIDYPDELAISKSTSGKKTTFLVRLRQSDVGKVIGKHGHTIIAIRNLLSAAASRHGEHAALEIIEPEQRREPAAVAGESRRSASSEPVAISGSTDEGVSAQPGA